MIILILLGIVVAIGLWGVGMYNGLIRLMNQVKEALSGIDVQLKRRHDLIPKLVETVKGYMGHERETLEKVTELRSQSMSNGSLAAKASVESALSAQLRTVFALAENYPDLKANQSFLELQKSISDIEDELQMARRYYNGTVREFNIRIASFPDVFAARMLGYTPAEFFGAADSDRADPVIKFSK